MTPYGKFENNKLAREARQGLFHSCKEFMYFIRKFLIYLKITFLRFVKNGFFSGKRGTLYLSLRLVLTSYDVDIYFKLK